MPLRDFQLWDGSVLSFQSVHAAPFSIMRQVVRIKSVEFMPFSLSLCLTICALMWFMYGLLIHDCYIAAPNFLGLALGVTQMILYLIYSKRRNEILAEVDIEDQPNNNELSDLHSKIAYLVQLGSIWIDCTLHLSIAFSVAVYAAPLTIMRQVVRTKSVEFMPLNGDRQIFTAKLIILFNLGAFGLILLFTSQITTASKRLAIVGWICAVFSLSLSAAHPLAIMTLVIRTKILEFMPFSLSLCQTICAVMWFMYGLSIHDYYIAAPNILGMAFGLSQMILYLIYSKRRNGISPEFDIEDQPNKAPVNKDDQVHSREEIEINTIQLTM
ncbi:hypothetical protein EZV62_010505 [Acer yangbiense]|uniref:Bidirectional sugar transporter SWEET n=1 Tax=Acer yangbiense TaxID=1000413 RepID=A0A5C7I2P8_9ROSI|nr:hypothetical protein EZV62_010505 [Acer yangbiense]